MNDKTEDPRVVRTKNLIIDAFLTLIKEKDFDAISVKDITKRATINRATFYRHYEDKYLLLSSIVEQMIWNKGFEQMKERTELNKETFRLLMNCFCNLVEDLQQTFGRNYDTVISLTESELREKLIQMMSTFFQDGDEEKNRIIVTMLVTSIYSAACSWISSEKKLPRDEFFETALPFLSGAISQLS